MDIPKTVEETVAEFLALPGIDVTKLKSGTHIIVETTQNVFELELREPRHNLFRIRGSDPKLRSGVTGQLFESTYDLAGRVVLPNWIGKSLRMQFSFKNGVFPCGPAISARIQTDDYYYDVF